MIFCTPEDQHDLFATAREQKGGLDAPFITEFTVTHTAPKSGHFLVPGDRAHTERLVQLLNAPIQGGLFAPSMPPPSTLPPATSTCPVTLP
jgi:hypothetical protein